MQTPNLRLASSGPLSEVLLPRRGLRGSALRAGCSPNRAGSKYLSSLSPTSTNRTEVSYVIPS